MPRFAGRDELSFGRRDPRSLVCRVGLWAGRHTIHVPASSGARLTVVSRPAVSSHYGDARGGHRGTQNVLVGRLWSAALPPVTAARNIKAWRETHIRIAGQTRAGDAGAGFVSAHIAHFPRFCRDLAGPRSGFVGCFVLSLRT